MKLPVISWWKIFIGCAVIALPLALGQVYFDREPLSVSITLFFFFPVSTICLFVLAWPLYLIARMVLNDDGVRRDHED